MGKMSVLELDTNVSRHAIIVHVVALTIRSFCRDVGREVSKRHSARCTVCVCAAPPHYEFLQLLGVRVRVSVKVEVSRRVCRQGVPWTLG